MVIADRLASRSQKVHFCIGICKFTPKMPVLGTRVSEVVELYTFQRLHWSFAAAAALGFQCSIRFRRTIEAFLFLRCSKLKKLLPGSPAPQTHPLHTDFLPNPMKRGAAKRDIHISSAIFLYTYLQIQGVPITGAR